MLTQTPRGTKDIYGPTMRVWHRVEDTIRETAAGFIFSEIRTPIFEHTELFQRGVGENTDVVQKEMYTFLDKGNRSITLRPEITAGVARAFVEHKIYAGSLPARFYYIGPNFRYEKPAAGRWRQFYQFGAELYGSLNPAADAEVIALADLVLKRLGIRDYELHINSLGGQECRARYNAALKNFLREHYGEICPTCQTRFEKNPMRVLDCKEEKCKAVIQNAPVPLDTLGEECRKHLDDIGRILETMDIHALLDGKIVRGLDYYTRTVFEFIDNGAGLTICGGGRYDNLIEECGGPATGAVGFAMGMERIILMLKEPDTGEQAQLYIGSIGENGFIKSQVLANELRKSGIAAEADVIGRGVKAQMKYADKTGARFSMIIGDEELASGYLTIKNMRTGEQFKKSFDSLIAFMREIKNENL